MATSPAHQFGQQVGLLLEEMIAPSLAAFCAERGLFLDSGGLRGKARPGRKVTWADKYGNSHDLDFVIERGGSPDVRGQPLAFIESAWRRYTKHSRNKAQEIQAAILPIAERHAWEAPFKGVILAGLFTAQAIAQLESHGFVVVYIDYASIVSAFAAQGLEISFDEETSDAAFSDALSALNALTCEQRDSLKHSLMEANRDKLSAFMHRLSVSLDRVVELITITPLYGQAQEFTVPDAAIVFLNNDEKPPASASLVRPLKIEVRLQFSDGTRIEGSFPDPARAIDFIHYAIKP